MKMDLRSASEPLPDLEGAGENLRYDRVYDLIKDARTEEDASLSMGIWERELKRADWNEVERLCTDALNTRSKDLQIAAWLCESWCHLYSWNGFESSFEYMSAFCSHFWAICYPELDADDDDALEHRIRILDWFLEALTQSVLFLPVVPDTSINPQALDLAIWLSAVNLDLVMRRSGVGEAMRDAEVDGQVTLARYRSLLKQAPTDYLIMVSEHTRQIQTKVQALENVLRETCNGQEPIFSKLREHLTEVERLCAFGLEGRSSQPVKETPVEPQPSSTSEVFQEVESAPVERAPEPVQTEITAQEGDTEVAVASKQDAYQAIGDLANYLMDLDPHSPGPYLAQLVASWSDKSLPQILDDAAHGTTQGHQILKMLAEIVKVQ